MKMKYLLLMIVASIFILSITCVCAQDNDTDLICSYDECDEVVLESVSADGFSDEKLEAVAEPEVISASNENEKLEGYYYDSEYNDIYEDNTIIAKDVTMYYGDVKFYTVKVLEDNKKPAPDVDVLFGIKGKNVKDLDIKTTNYKGIVSFPIKYGVGTHKVMAIVLAYDDNGKETGDGWFTYNKITIKSTIPTKTLTKSVKQKNKKFSIKFLNSKGKVLKNKKVKIKVKGKTYKIKTNSKGIAKIKINSFKKGKHSITAINPVTKEKRKIIVKITK